MRKSFQDQGLRINIIITDRREQLRTITRSVCSFSCWPHLPKHQNLAPYGRRQILAEMEASASHGIFLLKGILLFLAFVLFVFLLGFILEWHREVSASAEYSLDYLVWDDRNSGYPCVRVMCCFDWKGTRVIHLGSNYTDVHTCNQCTCILD